MPTRPGTGAREALDDGRPPLLLTDLYYLDHYGKSAHFPGHAVVLAGYDDDSAFLSDTAFEELQTTSLASLREARHGNHPIFALAGNMLTFDRRAEVGDLRDAAPAAVARNAKQMIDPPLGEFEGLPALRRFAAEVGDWPGTVEDWQWCARFAYQTIERRGTGGGNFRLMYSRFLEEAGYEQSDEAAGRGRGVDGAGRGARGRQRGRRGRRTALVGDREPRGSRPRGRGAALELAGRG